MSISEENRKPLYKKPPNITQIYRKPYTSLNTNGLQLKPTTNPNLPLGISAASEFRASSYKNFNEEFANWLSSQGITRKKLQSSSNLRKQVAKIREDAYRELREYLNETEPAIINQSYTEDLTNRGLVSRSGDIASLNIPSSYELNSTDLAEFNSLGVSEQDISNAKEAGRAQQLINSGLIKIENNQYVLSRDANNYSESERDKLTDFGFVFTTSTSNGLSDVQNSELNTLINHGLVTESNGKYLIKENVQLYDVSGQDLIYLQNLFGIPQTAISQRAYIVYLRDQGVISTKNGEISLLVSPTTLSNAKKDMLTKIGFDSNYVYTTGTDKFTPAEIEQQNKVFAEALATNKITQQEYNFAINQQNLNIEATNKIVSGLIYRGVLQVDTINPERINLGRSVLSLSAKDITDLNKVGIKISTTQVNTTKQLIETNTIKVVGDAITLTKPLNALSNIEIDKLRTLGFSIPNIPKGPQSALFDWGQTTFAQNGQLQAGTQFASAVFGQVLTDGADLLRFATQTVDVFNLIPDVDIQFRGPTLDNLGYMVTLSGAQKPFIVAANVALGVGEGIIAGASIAKAFQVTAAGINKIAVSLAKNPAVASALQRIPSFKGPATVKNITSWLKAHPNITNAIVFAPAVGLESVSIMNQLSDGVSVDRIVMESGKRLGFDLGMIAAVNKLSAAEKLTLQRAIKLEGVSTPQGTKLVLTLKDAQTLPKSVSDLMKLEYNPQLGKIVVVGIGKVEGASFPMAVEFSQQAWEELIAAGKLGPNYLVGAMMKWIDPKDFATILSKHPELAMIGGKLEKLTPQQIYNIFYKEIGAEGPWAKSLELGIKNTVLTGTESFSINLKAAYTIKDTNLVESLYQKLISSGVSESKASYLSAKILTEDIDTVSGILTSLKLSDSQIASIMAIRFEAGGPERGGTILYKALKKGGLSDDEIKKVIELSSSSQQGVSNTLSSGIPKLSNNGMKALVDMVPEETLISSNLSPQVLSKVVTVMTNTTAARFALLLTPSTFVSLDNKSISHTLLSMNDEQINSILPKLSAENLSVLAPKIDSSLISTISPKLSIDNLVSLIPVLSPEQINLVLPNLSTEQFNNIMERFNLSQTNILQYLQTGKFPEISSTNLPLPIIKKILDWQLNQRKTEQENQKNSFFKVTLYFGSSTLKYNIKSNSFDSATRQAMIRRGSSTIPSLIIINKTSEQSTK